MHKGTILHEGTSLYKDIIAERHFCTKGQCCTR